MEKEKKITKKRLRRLINANLTKKGTTIPGFQKILHRELGCVIDQYAIMAVLANLEDSEEAVLAGMGEFYEPDGSAFYLAKYGRGKKWKPPLRKKRKKIIKVKSNRRT